MKYPIIKFTHGCLVALCSVIMICFQSCNYYNVTVWKGNVHPTAVSRGGGSEDFYLNFDYADGKHGYTSQEAIELAFQAGKLPWLWCNVSHSGKATCSLPDQP